MKRIVAVLLSLCLMMGLLPIAVSAAEKETILIAGSDFQVSGNSTARIEQVLDVLKMHGISKADGAFFCGDYTLNSVEDNQGQSTVGLWKLKQLFTPIVGSKMTFVQGNHDPADTNGLSNPGNNDPASGDYGVFVIHEDQYLQYNWNYSLDVVKETASNLKKYLDEKVQSGWKKPIFVLSHVGLHWGNRTIKEGSAIHAKYLVDVLNEAGQKGLNVIFLYGHDHSGGYADFLGGGAIYFKKGDQIEVCTGEKKGHESRTIHFTYMNAGYIGYYSTSAPDTDAAVTMSVFRIQPDGSVIITRYDGDINLAKEHYGVHNLKSKGAYSEEFFKNNGYHVDLNLLEYASSRRVTATSDEPYDLPLPTITTTTTRPAYIGDPTTTDRTVVVTKPTATTTTTTAVAGVTTTTSGDANTTTAAPDGEAGNSTTGTVTTAADAETDSTTIPTEQASADQPAEGIAWWIWLCLGIVALLLIGAAVTIILLLKK